MQSDIERRAIAVGMYIVQNNATVRDTGVALGISKSTVHNDIHKYLKYIDNALYVAVMRVLRYNYSVRHIRGGESTRRIYAKENSNV